jgi:hypothetical protein
MTESGCLFPLERRIPWTLNETSRHRAHHGKNSPERIVK